jgi:hypothetical protein
VIWDLHHDPGTSKISPSKRFYGGLTSLCRSPFLVIVQNNSKMDCDKYHLKSLPLCSNLVFCVFYFCLHYAVILRSAKVRQEYLKIFILFECLYRGILLFFLFSF